MLKTSRGSRRCCLEPVESIVSQSVNGGEFLALMNDGAAGAVLTG